MTKRGAPLEWIKDYANYSGDDCIKWPFEIANYGYGTVKHNGKKRVASRVMCEEVHGLPPKHNMDAAHSCGNGYNACMNPNHLSWKTRIGNVADSRQHGTWIHGETVPQHKVNRIQVDVIRSLKGVARQKDIAIMFGITQSAVSRIMSKDTWAWRE